MKYALIYSYENHSYYLIPSNRETEDSREVERLYEFGQHELGTAKKILSNLVHAQQAA